MMSNTLDGLMKIIDMIKRFTVQQEKWKKKSKQKTKHRK